MTLQQLKPLIKRGEIGLIPKWLGYIKWDYGRDELKFVNGEYVMWQKELEEKMMNRDDLYYII